MDGWIDGLLDQCISERPLFFARAFINPLKSIYPILFSAKEFLNTCQVVGIDQIDRGGGESFPSD